MITLRLTAPMQALVSELLAAGGIERCTDERFLATAAAVEAIGARFVDLTATAPTKKEQATARHAAKRCADALSEARAKENRIPVSITVDEQVGLAMLVVDSLIPLAHDVTERLARRGLVTEIDAGWAVTTRGRAVVDGTPPGDLVPFAFFELGTIVRLAFDTVRGGDTPSEDPMAEGDVWQDIAAGEELFVSAIEAGRLWLSSRMTTGDWLALERAHPKIVYVVRRGRV